MTYSGLEKSVDGGAPVELFEFIMLPISWKYTNHTEDVTVLTNTYTAGTISRSKITQSDEINRSDLTIIAPRDFAPADRFRVIPPAEPMTVIVKRVHFGDTDSIIAWQGRVVSVSWKGAEAHMICEPVFSSLRRPGFRRYYTYICAHSLYGPKCKVTSPSYLESGTITSINGSVLEISEAAQKPDAYYNGGFIEYLTNEGLVEQRLIVDHTSTTITLSANPVELVNGSTIDMYPGCDHTLTTCATKYSNTNNYGGFPYIPTGSPFGGKMIF